MNLNHSRVQELNNVINAAIKSANSGVEHPAGSLISFDKIFLQMAI